jgi:hypothetical protein
MVGQCLNPLCVASFHYLRGGKLFLVNSHDYRGGRKDVHHRGVEYFWLCDSCALRMTLNLKGLQRFAKLQHLWEVVDAQDSGGVHGRTSSVKQPSM